MTDFLCTALAGIVLFIEDFWILWRKSSDLKGSLDNDEPNAYIFIQN